MSGQRTVFLDRDGTINHDVGFLSSPDQLEVLPGVPEALARLVEHGFRLVVATNQSGICRGYYTEADLAAIHARLQSMIEVPVSAWLHCPHHPDLTGPYGRVCTCRKPGSGLLLQARELLGGEFEGGFMVGDSARDLLAARDLPIRTVLLRSGVPIEPQRAKLEEAGAPATIELDALPAAVDWILEQD
ncbi:MAG: HAD family hydrolase [Planctomycetota bacterium]|nr:HAD family hydrolase [Planctomycetota bacterium]